MRLSGPSRCLSPFSRRSATAGPALPLGPWQGQGRYLMRKRLGKLKVLRKDSTQNKVFLVNE